MQNSTVLSHTPLLDVRPHDRNQDKPCVTVLPLASSSGTRKHAAFTSWDPGPLGRDTDTYIMALQANEISFLDFLACPRGFSDRRALPYLVETAPGVACGVACSVAEQAV